MRTMQQQVKSELKGMFTEHWKYLTVNAACKIGLFDLLLAKPLSLKDIAHKLNANENNLKHLINALCHIQFIFQRDEVYGLTEKAALLTESHPDSLKYACQNWAEEHLLAWQHLDYAVKEGRSAFEHLYGENYFSYLDKHPEKLDAYHKAMYEYARDDYQSLPDIIDFGHYKSVLDCGGGYGAAIQGVKTRHPQVRCYLFDRPQVIEKAVCNSVEKIGGDFFDMIPVFSEAIILSRILHDWENEKAGIILKNCYNALVGPATLFVIENCTEKIDNISFLSLNMAAVCNSYERTSNEYIHLCEQQGFSFVEMKPLNTLQTILIFQK